MLVHWTCTRLLVPLVERAAVHVTVLAPELAVHVLSGELGSLEVGVHFTASVFDAAEPPLDARPAGLFLRIR